MENVNKKTLFLLDLMKSGIDVTKRKVFLSKYVKEWQDSPRTFDRYFKLAKQQYVEYQVSIQKKKEALSIEKDLEPLKQGLKTKNERLLFYQKEVDKVEAQLRGEVEFTWLNMGKVQNSHQKDGTFVLPIQIQNELRRLIKEFQSEISKIEGDYAAKKQEHSFDKPTDIIIKGRKFASKD